MKKTRFMLLFFIVALFSIFSFSITLANEKMVFISKILKEKRKIEKILEYTSIYFYRSDHFKNNQSKPYKTYFIDKKNNLMVILDHIDKKYAEISDKSRSEIYDILNKYNLSIEEGSDIADYISEGMELEEAGYEQMEINGKKVMVKNSLVQGLHGLTFSVLNLTDLFPKDDAIKIFEIYCGKPIEIKKEKDKGFSPKIKFPVKISFGEEFSMTTQTIKLIDYNKSYFDMPKGYKKVSAKEIIMSIASKESK